MIGSFMDAEEQFREASGHLMAAGITLAHFVAYTQQTDPTLLAALQIHTDANIAYEDAYANLMRFADPPPPGLIQKSLRTVEGA